MQLKRRCNQEGRDLIKANRDCKLKAWKFLDGRWFIGWFHRGEDIKEGTVWTQQQADDAFEARIKECDAAVNRLVEVELNENQHSALVSLLYNVVEGGFEKSDMLKYLNANEFVKAAAEFPKWISVWIGKLDDKGKRIYKACPKFATLSDQQKTLFETVPKLLVGPIFETVLKPAGSKKVDSASPSAAALSSSSNANQVAAPSNNVGQGNFSESTPMQPASCCSLQPIEPELPLAPTTPSVNVPAAKPADSVPADSEPVDAEPADAEAVDAEPADAEPADAEPADAEPADAEPADAEPADAEPADSEPVDPKPVDSEPADSEPADLEAVDPKPVDPKPVDSEPADLEAVDAQPVGSEPPASPSAAVADLSITITVRPPTPVQLASCLLQPVQLMLSLASTPAAAPAAALSLQLSIIF